MKKWISILISIILLLNILILPVSADETPELSEEEMVMEYIKNVLPLYMLVEEGSSSDVFWITQGYSFQNTDRSAKNYFVFDANGYVGRMIVDSTDSGYTSTFSFGAIQSIQQLVYQETPFMILKPTEHVLLLCWEGGYEVLQNVNNDNIGDALHEMEPDFIPSFVQAELTEVELIDTALPYIDTTGYHVQLEPPYVENATSDMGKGLCWAASIASISRFRQGTNWTAYSLYSALKRYNMAEPSGTMAWYRSTFNYLGLTPTSSTGAPSWSTVYNALMSTRPLMFHIQRTSNGNTYAHAIVCKYFIGGNNQAVLGFMDPNEPSTQYATISSASIDLSTLVYTNSERTYTDLFGYIY